MSNFTIELSVGKLQHYGCKMPKYKSKFWLLYNCTEVINTPGPSPDINSIEKQRLPTNKKEFISFIKEWEEKYY